MNLTRCNHGHFYDMDKFESCPHCKNNGAGAAAEATVGLTGGTAGATEPYSGNAGDVTVPVGMTSPLDEVNTGLGKPIDATEEKTRRQHSRRFLIQIRLHLPKIQVFRISQEKIQQSHYLLCRQEHSLKK